MGNAWLKNVRDRFWKRKVKVVFLGEYGSGKTTALYKLNINKDVNSIPSIGINIETLEFAGDNMQIWDLCGASMPKQILLSEDVDGIAFFIDLSRNDDDYFQETQNLLQRVMERSKMQKVPLLFLGNKIDILTLNLAEAWERYSLQKYAKHNVKLISACALTGEGLKEGFQWLNDEIQKSK